MVLPILLMRSVIASNSAAWLSEDTLEREKDSSSSESRCKSAACTLMSSSNWVTSLLSSGTPAALVCRWAENSTANSSATENEQLATTLHLILTPSYFCSPVNRLLEDLGEHNSSCAQGALISYLCTPLSKGRNSSAWREKPERKSVSVRGARRLRTTALN